MNGSRAGGLREYIAPGSVAPLPALLPAIELREMVSQRCGSRGISTGTALFQSGAELAYHRHPFSEAATIIEGQAEVSIEGRKYRLSALDSVYFPAGVAHRMVNPSTDRSLLAHWAFSTAQPTRESVANIFPEVDLGGSVPALSSPERILRFADSEFYELSDQAFFTDLFAKRLGSSGMCGGFGRFQPGASLPCHVHRCDESITIIAGHAICEVMGRRYRLSGCDTAFVPEGYAHRFLNLSERPMAMIWVYASDEPERTILNAQYCTGELVWSGSERT